MTQPDDVIIEALGICAAYFDLKSAETEKIFSKWEFECLARELRESQEELCKAQKETK